MGMCVYVNVCLINIDIFMYYLARCDCKLWKVSSILLRFFWVLSYIIDEHSCLKRCIFTKLSQMCLIILHIFICQHAKCWHINIVQWSVIHQMWSGLFIWYFGLFSAFPSSYEKYSIFLKIHCWLYKFHLHFHFHSPSTNMIKNGRKIWTP